MTGEGVFYAAQAAFSYRGTAITQWADEPDQAAYEAVAEALGDLSEADDETACAEIVPTLDAAVPDGLSDEWADMVGLERAGVMLVVNAYRNA